MAESSQVARVVALVTGGSRGIGAAIALRLVQAGAAVLVAARGEEGCEELCTELREDGGSAWPLALDVADPRSIQHALARAQELARGHGPIAWLVNNAGMAESAPLLGGGGDDELMLRHMDVNFHGARRLTQALLPGMRKRGYGRVVNLASSAGMRGYAYVAAYCASKFALVGYTLSAAEELRGTGVSLNLVAPHYVDSPMLARAVEGLVEKTGMPAERAWDFFRGENPGGRLIAVDEVANAVVELLQGDETAALVELDGSANAHVHRPNSQASLGHVNEEAR